LRVLKYIVMMFITSIVLLSGCSDGRHDVQDGEGSGGTVLSEEDSFLSKEQSGESKEGDLAGKENPREQESESQKSTEGEERVNREEPTGEDNSSQEEPGDKTGSPEWDASDFVSLSDVIPDAILEIRYYSTYNFVGERIDGYEEPLAFMTKEAAEALREVSDELAEKGYRLKIYDAYRPQQAVDHFVRWAQDLNDVRMKEFFYPEAEKEDLFEKSYISKHSGHSRGSTVDLTLVDVATGEDVDMGGTFDYFGEISHTNYAGITKEQQENRKLLQDCMKAHGFKAIPQEWWHFTLKNEPYPDIYFTFPISSDSLK